MARGIKMLLQQLMMQLALIEWTERDLKEKIESPSFFSNAS
jgi:hypothetical protein